MLKDKIWGLGIKGIGLVTLLTCSLCSFAEEEITLEAEKVDYLEAQQLAIGKENVVVTYEDMRLTCDKVIVYTATKKAIAEGNVTLEQEGGTLTAEKLIYNFETKKGSSVPMNAQSEPWHGRGEEGEIVSKDRVKIKDGYVTTCDLEHPHYRLQAKKIKIFLGKKIVARNVRLFVGDVPIFYFPYYSHPLDDRPVCYIIPGHDSDWGWFTLMNCKFYPFEDSKARIHLDWRQHKGWATGLDYYFKGESLGKGELKTYYLKEDREEKTVEETTEEPGETLEEDAEEEVKESEENRYRIKMRYRYEWDPQTLGLLELHKSSDEDFRRDYFNRDYDDDEEPESFVSVNRKGKNFSLGFLARARVNDFYSDIERLPEIKLDIPAWKVKDSYFYYSGQTSFANLRRQVAEGEEEVEESAEETSELGETSDAEETLEEAEGLESETVPFNREPQTVRFDTYHNLTYPTRMPGGFKWLHFAPYAGLRETYYTQNREETRKNFFRGVFYSGFDVSTKFFRIYDPSTSPFNIEINKLRHLIIPSIRYNYTSEPTVSSEELGEFDYIDRIGERNAITFSLENALQTKWYGEEGQERGVDLLRFLARADYVIQDELEDIESEVANVWFELEAFPYSWLAVEVNAGLDHENGKVETAGFDLTIKKQKWDLWLTNRYRQDRSTVSAATLKWDIHPKWDIALYGRYNSEDGELEEQEYRLTRDLHCWLADFIYNRREEEETFWLVMKLTAFPEETLKLVTTSRRLRTE